MHGNSEKRVRRIADACMHACMHTCRRTCEGTRRENSARAKIGSARNAERRGTAAGPSSANKAAGTINRVILMSRQREKQDVPTAHSESRPPNRPLSLMRSTRRKYLRARLRASAAHSRSRTINYQVEERQPASRRLVWCIPGDFSVFPAASFHPRFSDRESGVGNPGGEEELCPSRDRFSGVSEYI